MGGLQGSFTVTDHQLFAGTTDGRVTFPRSAEMRSNVGSSA